MLNINTLIQLADTAITIEDWLIEEKLGRQSVNQILVDIVTKIQESKALSWHIQKPYLDITVIINPAKISVIEKKSLGKFVFKPNLMQKVNPDDEDEVGREMVRILNYFDAAIIRLSLNEE